MQPVKFDILSLGIDLEKRNRTHASDRHIHQLISSHPSFLQCVSCLHINLNFKGRLKQEWTQVFTFSSIVDLMFPAMKTLFLFALCFTLSQSADWDIFTFTQEWPTTVCVQGEQEHHKCVIPDGVSTWSIHGLWPTKYGTEGPTECRQVPFDANVIKNITSELSKFWANMYADTSDTSFWEHEWTKHGTCAMDLPATATEYLYFRKALDVMKGLDATILLNNKNIMPSDTKVYNVSQLETAIQDQIGVVPRIECAYDQKTRKHLVYEVEICLSKTFKPISCDQSKRYVRHHHHYNPNESNGSSGSSKYNSNCPHDGFLYPPIPKSRDIIG
ncbi:RNASET2 [Mytilus edulis]|uniref:RNASET2 n=2 Tax=Mytilus TaxID=6548 RepID=A0A8S3T3V6_MYTED|nr:RNASET2 [Mytilus edulis]